MIRITSKTDGFRRCGIVHPAAPREYPDDHFSREEIELLTAEPMLIVELVEGEPAGSGEEKPARGRAKK